MLCVCRKLFKYKPIFAKRDDVIVSGWMEDGVMPVKHVYFLPIGLVLSTISVIFRCFRLDSPKNDAFR